MKKYIFTDLAFETAGEKYRDEQNICGTIKKVTVSDYNEKRMMHHTVFFSPVLWRLNDEEFILLRDAISDAIYKAVALNINVCEKRKLSFLAVGLGNPQLTSDSLGADTVGKITVGKKSKNVSVYAVTPDVMGNTGIDTVSAIKAYVDLVNPTAVVAVDALMAKSYEHLASCIQISDGGITPGGGLKSSRRELSVETVGVPVVSVGVPMAVNSSTMLAETLKKGGISEIPEEIFELMNNSLNFIVTPKEADIAVRSASLLLSSAIDLSLSKFCV